MPSTKKSDAPEPSASPAPKVVGPLPAANMADAGSMDKIRDILFGNQARDYEKRFAKMEQQVNQEAADLKAELLKRIDSLEEYVKREMKDLNDRIKHETAQRNDSEKNIQNELKDAFETLNKKLIQEEENLAQKTAELREQILKLSKDLSSDMTTKFDQASQNLKDAARELDDAKVNRSDLSGFFLEIAMRLSGDDSLGGFSIE